MSKRLLIKTCVLVAVTSHVNTQYVDFFQSLNTFLQPLVTSKPRHDVTKRPETKHRQTTKQKYQDIIFFETDDFLKRREQSRTADPFSLFTTTTKPRRKTTKTTSHSDIYTQAPDFNNKKPDNSNKIINNNVNREVIRSISNDNREYNSNVVNGKKIDNHNGYNNNGHNDNGQIDYASENNNNYQAINYNTNNNRQTTTTNYYNNRQTTRKTTEYYNNVRTTRKTTPYYNNEQTTRLYDGDRTTRRTTNNRNIYGSYTTKNPLLNRPGVKPAVVDDNRPPITNRPVTSRPYDRPFESGTNGPPYKTERPRPPVNTRPPFEVQEPISTGIARPISSGNRPGVTGVIPGINSGVFPVGTNPSVSTGFNKPSGVENDDNAEIDIEIGPDEDEMSDSEKRRLYDMCERKCDEYKSARTKKVVALPLSSGAVSLNVSSCSANNVPLIIGGEVVRIEQFPHMALVGWKIVQGAGYSWKCGGSLLSEQYVLTAGHCTYHDKDYNVVSGPPHAVQLGSAIYNDRTATVVRIDAVIRHPKYKLRRSYHDVALIRLRSTVTFSDKISPVCLGVPPPVGEPVIATGWGKTEYGGDSSIELRGVSVTVWSMASCREVWGTSLKLPRGPASGDQLCAGERAGGKDTCQGDSGGPAQIQDGCLWRVVAVTSVGRSCGAPDTPALYATVPRAFIAAQVYTNSKTSRDGNNQYGNEGSTNNNRGNTNNNWGIGNNNGGIVNNNRGNVVSQSTRPQNNNNRPYSDSQSSSSDNRGIVNNDRGNVVSQGIRPQNNNNRPYSDSQSLSSNNRGIVNNDQGNVVSQGVRPQNNNNRPYSDSQSSSSNNRGIVNNNWNTNNRNNYGSTEPSTTNNNWSQFGTGNNNNNQNNGNNNRNVHEQSATNGNNWSVFGTSYNGNNQNNRNVYQQSGYSNNGQAQRPTTTTGYNQNNYNIANNNQQFGYNNEQGQNVRNTENPSDIRNYGTQSYNNGYNDNGNTGTTYNRDNRNTYNRDNEYNTYSVVSRPWWTR